MKRLCLWALVAVAGCGGSGHTLSSQLPAAATPHVTFVAPESARTPDGAKPLAPPVSLPPVTVAEKHVSVQGLRLIEGFEGYRRCAYWDPFGRVWTAGYGQTHGIRQGFCFTSRAAAQANLKASVESEYEWALRALAVPLNQHEWDALCSFAYNLGAGIFQGTTVGADLRARRFRWAADAMLQYDHAGGVVLPGLRTRREAEVRLFLKRPKPSPHQQLERDYARRRELRGLISRHACRTHTHRRPCPVLFAQGDAVNNSIRALHKQGVY